MEGKNRMTELQNYDLAGKVIGCAMSVHRELGSGYLEKVYENAMMVALQEASLSAVQQVPIKAKYHGVVIGDFIADLIVENELIVELKAVSNLVPVHEVQLVSYLKTTGIKDGLLLNFGSPSLQYKRKYRDRNEREEQNDRISELRGMGNSENM